MLGVGLLLAALHTATPRLPAGLAWAAARGPGRSRAARGRVGRRRGGAGAAALPARASTGPVLCTASALAGASLAPWAPAACLALSLAAAGVRRRRRRVPPGGGAAAPPARRRPTAAGEELSGLAAEAAMSLNVTDEDRKKRREVRRKRMMQQTKEVEEDAIRNLIDKGDDPDFFGFPYIWVQIGHLILGFTAVVGALVGGQGIEFALFNIQGEALEALRSGVTLIVFTNVLIAAWLAYEEMQIGPERVFNALGWGLKALAIGGVASWQRYGRLSKAAQKAAAEEAAPLL